MTPKYEIGQKVKITPVKSQRLSPRDSEIEAYAGQSGTITNYYGINSKMREVFYLYTVKIGDNPRDVTLYEDELESCIYWKQ